MSIILTKNGGSPCQATVKIEGERQFGRMTYTEVPGEPVEGGTSFPMRTGLCRWWSDIDW